MLFAPPLLLSLIVLAATGIALWRVHPHRIRHIGWAAAGPPAAVAGWLLYVSPGVADGVFVTERYPWATQFGLELSLRLDGLSLFFGLIITVIGAAVALYTHYYFEDDQRQGYFYLLLFLFMTSMLGLVWSNNLFVLYVFWEATSITSYLLIGYQDDDPEAIDGSRRALIVTGLGGLAMLAGFVLLGTAAGTYTISDILMASGLEQTASYPYFLVLILLGAFTKSAQFPFHFWLPGAMAAPTPASAYLHSATMVKAGVFLLARFHPALSGHPAWFWILLTVGGATYLLGAVSALRHYDLKALLAFATVSQLGALVMLLAFPGEIAITAVVIGIIAHALYKGPLFLIAGIVSHATDTRDTRQLSHLWRDLPLVTGVAVLATLSMSGFPFTFGFLAKEYLLETFLTAAHDGHHLFWWFAFATAAAGGALFVAYSVTLFWEAFLSPSESDPAEIHHDPSWPFVLAPLILTLIGATLPFLLHPVTRTLLQAPARSIAGSDITLAPELWHGFTPVLMTSLGAIAFGVMLFFVRRPIRRLLNLMPPSLAGIHLFDRCVYASYRLANSVTRLIQGGTLASQAGIVLLTACIVMVAALASASWQPTFGIEWLSYPTITEVILAALSMIAAILTVQVQTRLNAIISLGVVGIAVTLFFVIFSAPDLALTQLLVDILTVVLLVLVFYRIPPQSLPPLSLRVHLRNLSIAFLVGGLGFLLVLFSAGEPHHPTISSFFSQNALQLAHGANVVNVILVDFRGFDTLGEITVLAIAAVGGYALLRSVLLRTFYDIESLQPLNNSDSETSS